MSWWGSLWVRLVVVAALSLILLGAHRLRVASIHKRRRKLEHDMEEERRAQDALDQLFHLERIATLGELTATLAHELNQPLSAIVANAEAGRRFVANDAISLEDVDEILRDISAEGQRAGQVLQRLRAMLRRSPFVREPVNLNEVAEGVAELLRPDAKRRQSRIELDLIDPMPDVVGDPVQMQQVVLNLMINGLDAVEALGKGGGAVGVRTTVENGAVSVAVWDTGVGIDGLEEHVFKPFFTTKPDGLGMGVSLSRSIIEAHGGEITGVDNPGRGAIFSFSLPVVQPANS